MTSIGRPVKRSSVEGLNRFTSPPSISVAGMAADDQQVHDLTQQEARQIVLRATLLDADRPTDLLTVVERLTALPVEPTRAIAPSYDLVPWSRMGAAYEPIDLVELLEQREVYDDGDGIRPMADLGLHMAEMEIWPPWDGT